jgi:hypothetical protein
MFVFYVLCVSIMFSFVLYVILLFMFIHFSFSLRSILFAFRVTHLCFQYGWIQVMQFIEDEFHGLKFVNLIVNFFEMSMVSKEVL